MKILKVSLPYRASMNLPIRVASRDLAGAYFHG
jgi:hypothetical protein